MNEKHAKCAYWVSNLKSPKFQVFLGYFGSFQSGFLVGSFFGVERGDERARQISSRAIADTLNFVKRTIISGDALNNSLCWRKMSKKWRRKKQGNREGSISMQKRQGFKLRLHTLSQDLQQLWFQVESLRYVCIFSIFFDLCSMTQFFYFFYFQDLGHDVL